MLVQLYRHHFPGGGGQVAGQASQTGTDLKDRIRGLDLCRVCDLFQRNGVLEKILAQSLVWTQAIFPQQLGDIERGNIVHGQKGIPSSFVSLLVETVPPGDGHVPWLNWAT